MEKMKKLCSIALAALALGGMGLTPAEAAYKPKITSKMSGQFTKDVKKVVTTLKAMPKPIRWTFYAEKLGLCFMPQNGASGHNSASGNLLDGSHFIGVDGKEYDAKAEIKVITDDKPWVFCAGSLERLGREVVFSKLSNEVTAIVLENAKYHLDKMAEKMPEMRDMYLAHLAKLCYLPDGKSPYDNLITHTGPHKQPIQVYEIEKRGSKFVDTEGNEHSYDELHKKYGSLCPGSHSWGTLNVCAHHVGAKDILDRYPDEVKKLRANYKKKMQELSTGATAPKEDNEEETSEPDEKSESLAKKLGVTYCPKTNADRMGGQFKKDLQDLVAEWKSMPKSQRWAAIAERMGLLFMPPNGASGHKSDGWRIDGSHFIGADGLEYDWVSELKSVNRGPHIGGNTDRLGREIVFSQMPDEIAELVLQNAKYHLDKMEEEQPERRDMYLAFLAKLCYLPDGKSPYEKLETKIAPHKRPIQNYVLDGKGCKFVDTEGTEHNFDDITRKYLFLHDARWIILNVCAHHVGQDAILALCPEEVKKLRANYEKRMEELKE